MRHLLLVVLFALCSTAVHAQSNPPFRSPALDSNCYFPQIGMPGEIDTIYGGQIIDTVVHSPGDTTFYGSGIGAYIHNLGPKPDGSFGNMLLGSESGVPMFDQAPTGPNFNLHDLRAKAQNLRIDRQRIRFGHFRDRSHLDIFEEGAWRIYWADDAGGYDSARHTDLKTNIYGSWGIGKAPENAIFGAAYVAHLTSDSVDDIVAGFFTSDSIIARDSDYLALFKGGTELGNKKIAYEDTSIVVPPPIPI